MSLKEKGCFVTVGATAAFDDLVAAALSPELLSTLTQAGYTRLAIQFGKTGAPFFVSCLSNAKRDFGGEIPGDLEVEGFEFNLGDFQEVMKSIVCGPNGGLLIAHAGKRCLIQNRGQADDN
jgi:beta-1,4-N-acetylglucosaminyltransferase